jgi:hypothetical protein
LIGRGIGPAAVTAIMGVPTVGQVRSWAGLDVHAAKVAAAVIDAESGELSFRRLGGSTKEVAGFCCSLPAPARGGFRGRTDRVWPGQSAPGRRGRVPGGGTGQDRPCTAGPRQDRPPPPKRGSRCCSLDKRHAISADPPKTHSERLTN